jgi:hypothetical protein
MYYVYIIRQGLTGYTKIGITNTLDARLAELQVANPTRLEINYVIDCACFDDALKVERMLHERYKSKRLQGEWFDVSYTRVIEDLDWCIEMANAMLGGRLYKRNVTSKKNPRKSKPIVPNNTQHMRNENGMTPAEERVWRYLENTPDAILLSVRKLGEATKTNKTTAATVLAAYKSARAREE